jgi:homeobox protein cut-like
MEDMISERVLAKQNELNAEYDERLRNYDERCVSAAFQAVFSRPGRS